MPFVSDELFNEICMANDIIDYASSFMTLKKNGRSYKACCPFHNEKTPSFNIDRDKQLFHCFGCGASGNFVQLVMRLEGLDYRDAMRSLAEKAGIVIPESGIRQSDELTKKKDKIIEMNRIAARFFYDCLIDPEKGRTAREYLSARKLSKNTVIKFGLGYAPDTKDALLNLLRSKGYKDGEIIEAGLAVTRNGSAVDKYRNRVMFPIINVRGKVIGFGGRVAGSHELSNGFKIPKYLNSPQTLVFDKGANLFALNLAKNSNEKDLILCEGNMDVITVHQAGITNCVATLGTAITDAQAKLMLRYGNEILICYDMDEAGTTAALRAIDIITAAGGKARVMRLSGAKDPDEYITKYGVSGFKKAIEKAVAATEFKISLVRQRYDINDTEGKINFVEEVAKILSGLNDIVEVEAYIKKTSMETGISEQSIFGKYTEQKNKVRRPSPAKTKEEYKRREIARINNDRPKEERVTNALLEAEKRVLSLISKSRRLCMRAFEIITAEEFSNSVYSTLAKRIYEYAKEGNEVEAGVVLNEFSGDENSANMAAEIFFNQEEYSDNDATLYDLIYTMKQNKLNSKMNAATDPHEIGRLIQEKNELENARSQWQLNS